MTARRCSHILDTYPRDELFAVLRGRAPRHRARHPRAAGAPARRPLRAPRSVRAFRLGLRLCAARALQHRVAPALRRDPGEGLQRHRRQLFRRSSTSPCWRACISSCARRRGPRPRSMSPRSSASSPRRRGAGPTGSARRSCRRSAKKPALRSSAAMAPPSRADTASASRPRPRSTTSSSIEEVARGLPLGMTLHRPLEAQATELRFKIYRAGAPVALSDILPMLEHMGLKVIAEVPYAITPADAAEPVWMQDFSLLSPAGRGRCRPPQGAVRGRLRARVVRARWKATASTASSCWPGSTGARSSCSGSMPR